MMRTKVVMTSGVRSRTGRNWSVGLCSFASLVDSYKLWSTSNRKVDEGIEHRVANPKSKRAEERKAEEEGRKLLS